MTQSPAADNHLLALADMILTEAGFATRRALVIPPDEQWLLAEDQFFLVAVVAAASFSDARRLESYAAAEFLERVARPDVGAKRWDAYLVVLTEEIADDPEEIRELVELQYNTRGVRRLVVDGVHDRASITAGLRPFFPLPGPLPGGLSDSLTDLSEQLVLNGIERDKAERYVAAFAESGNLDAL